MGRKKLKKGNNLFYKKFFNLTWEKIVIGLVVFSLFFFFRNIFIENIPEIFNLIGGYNNFLRVIEIVIPLYFLISIIYSFKNRKKVKVVRTPFFYLTWRKTGIVILLWIIAVVLHNLIYAFFVYFFKIEFEEPLFFIFASVFVPLYFLVSVIYSLIKKFISQR